MNRVATYGLETALDHTLSYLGRYLLVGFVPILLVSFGMGRAGLGVAVVLSIAHGISMVVMFPAAIAINLMALRYARGRTWDRQPWRAWLGGALAVGLVWGSYIGAAFLRIEPSALLIRLVGQSLAMLLHGVGLVLTASAVSLAAAWSVPSRGRA
jgi:hypothetical protein